MNENTEFNLELAKRGMAVIVCWDDGEAMYFLSRRKNTFENVNTDFDDFFELDDLPSNPMRMATRAECDAAGVEYIEHPVSAEELAELRKDSKRIDWLIEHSEMFYYHPAKCEYCVSHYFLDTTDDKVVYAKNPREAIDAAMKGGE